MTVEYRQKEALLADNHLRVVLHSFFMGGKRNPTQKAEIEAILSAVIPGSLEISNRTMNEINQLIEAQKREPGPAEPSCHCTIGLPCRRRTSPKNWSPN